MSKVSELVELNLVSGPGTISVFEEIFPDILHEEYTLPSAFMSALWERYNSSTVYNSSLNGNVFECLIAVLLYRSGVTPLFPEASLTFVHNVKFDFVAFEDDGPIVFSAKTSFRERYKQADLEGRFLKQVHMKAKCYLMTVDVVAAKNVSKKIDKGEVTGIDQVIVMTSSALDELILNLQSKTFIIPSQVDVVKSSKIIEKDIR